MRNVLWSMSTLVPLPMVLASTGALLATPDGGGLNHSNGARCTPMVCGGWRWPAPSSPLLSPPTPPPSSRPRSNPPPPPAVHSASPAGRFAGLVPPLAGVGHRLRCDGGSRPRLRTSRRARARRIPPSRTLIAPPLPGTASWRPRQALGASCCGPHARDACRQDRRNAALVHARVPSKGIGHDVFATRRPLPSSCK